MPGGDIVVVGAGIAGISAAYHLGVLHEAGHVVLIDPRPPMTLTSDKSTECYRNWWPNAPMVGLMNRSIDIFEQLAEEVDFGLNRRGYLFVTAQEAGAHGFREQLDTITPLGASAVFLDQDDLRESYPFITDDAVAGLLLTRAGWMRAQDLGQWMLERAKEAGVDVISAAVTSVGDGGVLLESGETVTASQVVIAAGPMSPHLAATAGLDLPLFSELHLKVAFRDHLGAIPRDAPMTIWSDTQVIPWTDDERAALVEMGRSDLIGELPVFCHFRPEGGEDSPYIVALWEYHDEIVEPTWPLPVDELYPEVVIRGLTTMVPGLSAYADRLPPSSIDGGYYSRTKENRPLIGPSGAEGIHLLCGMSGFGIMASAGAADLLARHITGGEIPDYADAFLLSRYDDPSYLAAFEGAFDGQL